MFVAQMADCGASYLCGDGGGRGGRGGVVMGKMRMVMMVLVVIRKNNDC